MSTSQKHRDISDIELFFIRLTEKMAVFSVFLFFIGLATMFYFHIDVGSERELAKFLHNFGYTGYKFDPVAGAVAFMLGSIFLNVCARCFNQAMDFVSGMQTWKGAK